MAHDLVWGSKFLDYGGAHYNVMHPLFGALGNGQVVGGVITGTDDLASFDACRVKSAADGIPMYIPALPAGRFFRLTNTFSIPNDNFHLYGSGFRSLICIHNAAGANAITLSAANHSVIKGIGITGVIGSGHGIELTSQSYRCALEDIVVAWVDGDGFKITSGLSTTMHRCKTDQNGGFDPGALGSSLRGNINNGFHVLNTVPGEVLDTTCINCSVEAGAGHASGYGIKVGATTGALVTQFRWIGGIIEGLEKLVYMRCHDGLISGAYIEHPAGTTVTGVTLDTCDNTVIRDGNVQCDIELLGACLGTRIEQVRCYGIDISATSLHTRIDNIQYGNNTLGPTDGQIIDRSGTADITATRNGSNDFYAVGHNAGSRAVLYFGTNMEDWEVSTTMPCGFNKLAGTVAKEATIFRSGTYSMKCTLASDFQACGSILLQPINMIKGKWITVEAWAYSNTGTAYIVGNKSNGAATYFKGAHLTNTWERILVSFYVDTDATSFQVQLSGTTGIVYYDGVKIWVDDYTHVNEMVLDGSATPEISYGGYGGYFVPLLITSGTPTITNFLKPHVGKPFTILFTGATIISDNANIKLLGAANFTGTADDTMTLVYKSDGIFYEISRSVN